MRYHGPIWDYDIYIYIYIYEWIIIYGPECVSHHIWATILLNLRYMMGYTFGSM